MPVEIPMPADFREFAVDKNNATVGKHYGVSEWTITKWSKQMPPEWRKARKSRIRSIANGVRAVELTQAALDDMRRMSIEAVAVKHGLSYRQCRDARQKYGIKRDLAKPVKPANVIPTPPDFQQVAWSLSYREIAAHYKIGETTATRIVKEQPLEWQLSRNAEVERKTNLKLRERHRAARRESGVGVDSWGQPYRLRERAYPFTREERATVFLQHHYSSVWHVGREHPSMRGIYQVGNHQVDAETLLAMAKSKGWRG